MAKDFELTFGVVGQAVAITGLESLINLTTQLTNKIKDQARAVSEYTSVVNGHAVSVREADAATAGLIDTVELHRTAARLEAAGLEVTTAQMTALSVAGAQFAQRTGIPVTEAFQRITTSTISADEGLRQFGITIQAGGTIAERQARVLQSLEARYSGLTVEVRNTDEAISQLSNTWGTAWTEMLADLERSAGPMRTIITGLTEKLQEMVNALETARSAAENRERRERADPARAQQAQLDAVRRQMAAAGIGGLQERQTGAGAVGDFIRTVVPAGIAASAIQRGLAARPQATRRRRQLEQRLRARERSLIADIDRRRRESPPEEAPLTAAEVSPFATIGMGGGPDVQTGQQAGAELARTREFRDEEERQRLERQGGGASRTAREQQAARDARDVLLAEQRETAGAMLKERQSTIDRQREQDERRMEDRQHFADVAEDLRQKELDEERAAGDVRKELLEKASEQERRLAEEREERLRKLTDVTTASSQLIGDIANAALAAAGTTERGQKIVNAIIGTATVAREATEAVVEVARAASSAASNDVSGAVLHGIAAAAHVAAGAKAAAELGGKKKGGSSGAPGAGGGSVNRPEFTSGGTQQTADNTSITFVNHGAVTTREVSDDLNQAALNSSRRQAA